jgi:hypothetical protein
MPRLTSIQNVRSGEHNCNIVRRWVPRRNCVRICVVINHSTGQHFTGIGFGKNAARCSAYMNMQFQRKICWYAHCDRTRRLLATAESEEVECVWIHPGAQRQMLYSLMADDRPYPTPVFGDSGRLDALLFIDGAGTEIRFTIQPDNRRSEPRGLAEQPFMVREDQLTTAQSFAREAERRRRERELEEHLASQRASYDAFRVAGTLSGRMSGQNVRNN